MALMETFMGRFTGDLYFIFPEIREKTPVVTVKKQKRFRNKPIQRNVHRITVTVSDYPKL